MARSIAGDPPANLPSPYQTPPNGLPAPAAPSPFNYTNQPSMPGPAVATTPTPAGLWNAFRRRWVLGTFIGGLVAAAVAVALWLAMPAGKHQARALVQLQPKQAEFVAKSNEDFEAYRRHQIFLIKTRDLITRVLADPAVGSLDMVKQSDDPVTMLEGGLRVTVAAPEILEVSLTGNNIEDMKTVLDHLMKRYVEDASSIDRKHRDDQINSLEKLRANVQLDIDLQEKAIEQLARNAGVTNADGTNSALGALHRRHVEADGLFVAAGREIGRLEAERKVLTKQLEDNDPKAPLDPVILAQVVAENPRVGKAKEAYEQHRGFVEREALKAPNPKESEYIRDLEAGSKKLLEEWKAIEKTVATDSAAIVRARDNARKQARVADLDTLIDIKKEQQEAYRVERDALQKVIANAAGNGVNIEAMREPLKHRREILGKIQSQLTQLQVGGAQVQRAQVRGPAEGIPNNNQNKKLVVASAGGIVSFLGVVLLVSLLEWRTRRVDGVDQVVSELGMRVIGTVPAFPNRANLQAATEAGGANWRFVLNESINSTRTMLLHIAKGQSMQVVMVTSATQGEGKTSLASQLATSMATAGMRTLLVDCDLRNPSVMKLFELPLIPGVSEVLRQEVDVADAVQATAVPNLWVIPAGQCSNATIAALAQGHPLETLFNRLRGQFDFVIVDSCPVLPVADALLIAQHVDGVVFSIMQDISQLPKVITASEKLTQLNIPLVGAVVNGIRQDVYSYGYNYVKQLPA